MEIVLFEPKIPQNTGNIIRLSACINAKLSIVGSIPFSMDDSSLRRAGLDYYKEIEIQRFLSWEEFEICLAKNNKSISDIAFFSRFAKRIYTNYKYSLSSILVFGSETTGLPVFLLEKIYKECPDNLLRIPVSKRCRSLNLANSVSIVVYEALRQNNFEGLVLYI